MKALQTRSTKRWYGKGPMAARGPQLLSIAALPIIHILIFCYFPMGGIVMAFKRYRADLGIFGSPWIGLENFKYFFTAPDFARIIGNTLYLNIIFIITGMVCNIALAILLYELKSKMGTKIYQTIMITPNFISWVLGAYMLYGFLQPEFGILNNFITKFGMEKIYWYSNPEPWPLILNIAHVWKGVGMGCLLYYATLMGIDSSLFEAAEIDGANRWQKIRYISIPCLKSIVVIQSIMSIGGIFNSDFGLFYQLPMDQGVLYKTTDVLDTWIFRAMRTLRDYGMSSAAGLLKSIVGFILIFLTNAIVRKVDNENSLF